MPGGVFVDAVTGKLLDYSGHEINVETPSGDLNPSDTWAKRSVELLIAQGIVNNSHLNYRTELTRAEAIKMLSIAKGFQNYDVYQTQTATFADVPKDNEYFYFVENAVKQKIIEAGGQFKGNEKITKEEFVKLLTNTIGYSDIAKYTKIFKLDGITIVNPDNTGSVAICNAFDILPISPGATFDGR